MEIIRVNSTPASAVFVALPSAGELPDNVASFGLVQICRLRLNDVPVGDPAVELGWNIHAANGIMNATLDRDHDNGWFMDNMLKEPPQNNFIYTMEAYDDPPDLLSTLKQLGGEEGGVRYRHDGEEEAFSGPDFKASYGPRTVVVGTQQDQYPMLWDTPAGHGADTKLDFQVHLVYLTGAGINTTVVISNGFSWTFSGDNVESLFDKVLLGPSPEFTWCMQRCVDYQNDIKHTQWELLIHSQNVGGSSDGVAP